MSELTARKIRGWMRCVGGHLERIQKECPNINIDIPFVITNIFYSGIPKSNHKDYVKKVLSFGEDYFQLEK